MNVSTKLFATATVALTFVVGCAPRLTVSEFVNTRLARDPRLTALLEAADSGEKAYNLVADTPIEEIDANPKSINELVNKAHDSWRRAKSYRSAASSTLSAEGVKLVDLGKPEASHVPVARMGGIVFRVQATRYKVVVLGIDTSRGVPMLNFDTAMNPSIEADFQDYLRGDRIDVGGAFVGRLKRGRTFVKQDEASASEETPAPSTGCSKDTDCKGARICVQRDCIDPKK